MASLRSLFVASAVGLSLVAAPVAAPTSSGISGVVAAHAADETRTTDADVTPRRRAERYTPKAGVKMNNPLSSKNNWNINRHINKTIRSVRRGQTISIFSWNFDSGQYRQNLIAAHKRGVAVRVIMSANMARQQNRATGDFWQLKRALKKGNKKRPKSRRSWTKLCNGSCRGSRGIPHTKLFLFSKAGKARNVAIVTSANMTDAAALNQWGEAYTIRGDQRLYKYFVKIFRQSSRDKKVRRSWQRFRSGKHIVTVLPAKAARQSNRDPWLQALAPVKCKGASNGNRGRTVIRVGQTAILDARGLKLARRIKRLHNQGCNIQVLTAELGHQVQQVLRSRSGRGPVPLRQLVLDYDGDGAFDKYIHTKVMSIRGHYGKNRSARVAFNGTANWTRLAMISDEIFMQVNSGNTARKYERFVTRAFKNMPKGAPIIPRRTTDSGLDPFRYVEIH